MKRYLPFIVIAGVLATFAGGGIILFHQHRPDLRPSAGGEPGAEPPHIRGSADAPVLLEEFGDFECMPCFMLWPALRNLEHDFGQKLAVVFSERPLPQHENAVPAAKAAEAAGLQGKFWEMHDKLFLERRLWVREANPRGYFIEAARQIGLDVDRFSQDMSGAAVMERLRKDGKRADSLKIDRTPAVFINGQRVQLQGDVESGLHKSIDSALHSAK